MLDFLIANAGTILISLMLICALSLIIRNLINIKKQGRSPCGCDCAHCAAGCSCCHK